MVSNVLQPGVYEKLARQGEGAGPFGLTDGQHYAERVLMRRAGWYTLMGRLGSGDLSAEDMRRILDGLDGSTAFVVLSEKATLDERYGRVVEPGGMPAYVMQHAVYVLIAHVMHIVLSDDSSADNETDAIELVRYQAKNVPLPLQCIKRSELRAFFENRGAI